MDALLEALRAYQSSSPARWVGVYRFLPVWGGIALGALGLALVVKGTGRALHFVAAVVGALVGFIATGPVMRVLGLGAADLTCASLASAGLAVLGFLFPPGVIFFAFGIPAGLVGADWAGQADALLGFAPGLLLVGTVAAIFHRPVSVVAAALVGAWAMVLGALAALHPFGNWVKVAARSPALLLGVAFCIAALSCARQLGWQKRPEVLAREQAEARRRAQRAAEDEAIQRRWEEEARQREEG